MFKKGLSVVAALVLLIASAVPVLATHQEENGNWFTNSVIGDGILKTCYEGGTPVYTNRSAIAQGFNYWDGINGSGPIGVRFVSNGACATGDDSNVRVYWTDLGSCSVAANAPVTSNHSVMVMNFNSNSCKPPWWWGLAGSGQVPAGYYDALTTGAHEMGHLLGLRHEDEVSPNAYDDLMDIGAANCNLGLRTTFMSYTDANYMNHMYTGLPDPSPHYAYGNNRTCVE